MPLRESVLLDLFDQFGSVNLEYRVIVNRGGFVQPKFGIRQERIEGFWEVLQT